MICLKVLSEKLGVKNKVFLPGFSMLEAVK
jgi:hypothetical protein